MYLIDTVISRNRSVENRLSFAYRKLSVVTVKWNVHKEKVHSIEVYERIWHFFDFRISTINNKKISWLSGFRDQRLTLFLLYLFHRKFLFFLGLQLLIFLFFVVLCFNREKRFDSFPKWMVEVKSFSRLKPLTRRTL